MQVSRFRDGTRKITHISEVCGFDHASGAYAVNDLFVRRVLGKDRNGQVRSELVPTGTLPSAMDAIEVMGLEIPEAMREAAMNDRPTAVADQKAPGRHAVDKRPPTTRAT